MGLWLPRRFRGYGSAISGREPNLLSGHEMEFHEGEIPNKLVSGGGTPLQMTDPRTAYQATDPVMGRTARFIGLSPHYMYGADITASTVTVQFCFKVYEYPAVNWTMLFNSMGTDRVSVNLRGTGELFSTVEATSYFTGVTIIPDKWYMVTTTWNATNGTVQLYLDAELLVDASGHTISTDVFRLNTLTEINMQYADILVLNRELSHDEIKNWYATYARRAQFLEDFSGAFVSSADQGGAAGDPIENTAWKCADAAGRFRIVDAAIPPNQNAKALKCTTDGAAYIENQWLGLKADDPEAAYGTWEWWFKKGTDVTVARIIFMASGTTHATSLVGYRLEVTSDGTILVRECGAGTTHAQTAAGYISQNEWNRYTITRRYDGQFTVYINGILMDVTGGSGTNPFTDDTHQVGTYFTNEMAAEDEVTHLSKRFGVAP